MSSLLTKLLIAIPSCNTYLGNETSANRNEPERRAACRETWLKDCSVDYKFFFGAGYTPVSDDEVVLDVPEGYVGLSLKFRSICQWALDHGYDYLFRVDTDAYVWVDRLLQSGFEAHNYSGYTIPYPEHIAWARYASGAGWTLSRKAMAIVAASNPDHPADDLWVGRVLFEHGIQCYRDTRYVVGHDSHFVSLEHLPSLHPFIVLHALRPDNIRQVHALPYPGDDLTPPTKSFLEPDFQFNYGRKTVDCSCSHCKQ